jgi:hypothetical protein
MFWLALSNWEVILSVVTPIAVAVVLLALEVRGPWAKALQRPSALVGPYFTGVAILFGMFSAQLMNDAWQKIGDARQSVQTEADALQALIQVARVSDQDGLLPPIKAYAVAASKEHRASHVSPDARAEADKAYEELMASVATSSGGYGAIRGFALTTVADLRRARDQRLYLGDDETIVMKWLTTLVLGALTQLAIMLVHTGNRSAVRVSVGLFTVAFTFCLVVVAVFDAPFDTVLAQEPAKTFSQVIKGL